MNYFTIMGDNTTHRTVRPQNNAVRYCQPIGFGYFSFSFL